MKNQIKRVLYLGAKSLKHVLEFFKKFMKMLVMKKKLHTFQKCFCV